MGLSQLITTTDIANTNIGINNTAGNSTTNAVVLGNKQNVGIGTNTPVYGLHLGNASGTFVPQIYLTGSTAPAIPTNAGDAIISIVNGMPTITSGTSGYSGSIVVSNSNVGDETAGTGTLNGIIGTVVSTTAVKSNSIILVSRNVGSSNVPDIVNIGSLTVASIIDNTSFSVYSTVLTDVAQFNWFIINR